MVKRFRMIAGPNGSGKSTLVQWLRDDYSVNFYTFVNADEILAEYDAEFGWSFSMPADVLPAWFVQAI